MAGDTVQEVKNKLSIQDVVGPYVKLHRAGRSLVGLCPFHKEKTPSFHVSLERGSYHCFGCGEGGDMFSFIEKIEGVDFKGALKILAEKAGVPLEYSSGGKERTDKRERLHSVMARVAQWYTSHLPGSVAETYARTRGLTDATIAAWGIGYAPEGWRALLEALQAEGYTTQEFLAAGLIKESEGKPGTYYDRFRNRLMFPIRDTTGRIIAFTGRTLETGDQSVGVQNAKYLNSPETDLYHKSDILFGLDIAKDAIRTRGFTMLVEGQMDLLHAHQADFGNTVALSGTALSDKHLALMKRYSDNLMLVLDADNAGLKASASAAQAALHAGLRVKAARLPLGEDPADLITRDAKDFATRVKGAEPIVEFFLAVLAERERDSGRLLRHVEAVVLPLVAATKSPMERERALQAVGRALGLSTESVRESLARLPRGGVSAPAAVAPRATSQATSAVVARATLLSGAIHAYPDSPLARRIQTEYTRIIGDETPLATTPTERVLFEAEQAFGEEPGEHAADELLRAFEEAVIREAYQEEVANLRQAETAGDVAMIETTSARCAELSARLASLT